MPSPTVALSVNKKKKACAAAINSMECELKIVKAAADAVIYMHNNSHFALSEDVNEPMLTVWTFFQNLLEPDVRTSAGSQEINKVVAALLGDWVESSSYGPLDLKCRNKSVRGRCIAIVAAFYRAMSDMSEENTSFCLTIPEDEPDYYPRELWHQFWSCLEANVRFAAYEVHEKYLKDFVSEKSKRDTNLEPFCEPDEDVIDAFPDEVIAKLSSNSDSKAAPASAIAIDDDDDSKYVKIVLPDNINRGAEARYGCAERKALPPAVLLYEKKSDLAASSDNSKIGGSSVLTGNKRSASETLAIVEAAPAKRVAKKPIQTLPAEDLELNTVATLAFRAMDTLLERGMLDATECDHKYGIVGEFWDEFMRSMPDNIHDRIHLARGDVKSIFRRDY
jgi:hypothetical protein